MSVISVNPGGRPEASSTRAPPPTCVRELLPGCRSSCLPAARWRCRCGTWFPPWGLLLSPAARSPVQSYLLVKNSLSEDVCLCLLLQHLWGQSAGPPPPTAVSPYLRQQPAAAASPCSSPSRPGESPPRWLWHPAVAAAVDRCMMGGRERGR